MTAVLDEIWYRIGLSSTGNVEGFASLRKEAKRTPDLLAGTVATLLDLLIDEGLEPVGQGNIHGPHGNTFDDLAIFGNVMTII